MRSKGSMTCFAAITIMLVAAFLFALLEAGRGYEMNKVAAMNSCSATESVFAEFVSPMWVDYHLLGVPLCDSTGANPRVQTLAKQYASASSKSEGALFTNLLAMEPTEVKLMEWVLLTDGEGDVFVSACAAYMRENLLFEGVDSLAAYAEGTKELMESEYADPGAVEHALEAMEEIGEESEEVSGLKEDAIVPTKGGAEGSSILELCQNTKGKGVLALVIPDTSKLSEKAISLEDTLGQRSLAKGNGPVEASKLEETILFEAYLNKYMACYLGEARGDVPRALDYEREYIIGGKSSDVENLRATIDRILLVREASNLMYLACDATKTAEAEALALVLAGATANPLIVEAVKWGILAAWAYFESILDARTLLAGKRIPFVKDATTWTSDLAGLSQIADGYLMAKDVELGVSYQDYLGILMLLDGEKKAALRAMDVVEQTVRAQSGYSSFRMDETMVEGSFTYVYQYPSVFLGMDTLTKGRNGKYQLEKEVKYSYRKKAGV